MCCYPKLKNDLDTSRTEAAKWFNVSQNEKSGKRKLSRANTLLALKREKYRAKEPTLSQTLLEFSYYSLSRNEIVGRHCPHQQLPDPYPKGYEAHIGLFASSPYNAWTDTFSTPPG